MATEVVIPALGITATRGKIVKWLKQEGQPVERGEPLFIVETEKVTTEVESPASGILARILMPAGAEAPTLALVGLITAPGEELPAEYAALAPGEAAAPQAETVPQAESRAETPAPGQILAVPAARRLAREKGLDLAQVTGSGPGGVILFRDVEAAAAPAEPRARVSPLAREIARQEGLALEGIRGSGPGGRIMRADVVARTARAGRAGFDLGQVIPLSHVRRVIARRLTESVVTAPHIYLFSEVWLDPLLDFRRELLPDFEKHFELRPSLNDFLIKAVALNILDFPLLNAQLQGDEIRIMPEVNIGLAVARPEGLIVPAIAQADRLGLVEIARQRADLVARAREDKLTLPELERGTFTISSLAQYDVIAFTAILNPPQSGILTVGKTDEKLVLMDGQVQARRVARLGLSVDHRVVDGSLAAEFLQGLKQKLERPAFTFLHL